MSDFTQLLERLSTSRTSTNGVCDGCLIELAGMSGVGLVAMTGNAVREPICATGGVSLALERLQFTLGEGPSLEAFDSSAPVLAGDLTSGEFRARWPAFAPEAVGIGVRAVFAFPLRVGAVRVGVLEAYRNEPGAMSDDQISQALIVCQAAMVTLLDIDAGAAGTGMMPYRAEVHQATGMIVAQLDVTAEEAFVRLRARAYAEGRTLEDVARDVVDRRVRFDERMV